MDPISVNFLHGTAHELYGSEGPPFLPRCVYFDAILSLLSGRSAKRI